MIQAAAEASAEPISLNQEPETFEDAVVSLYAFSDEGYRKQNSETPLSGSILLHVATKRLLQLDKNYR
jgi:hypothetical protein